MHARRSGRSVRLPRNRICGAGQHGPRRVDTRLRACAAGRRQLPIHGARAHAAAERPARVVARAEGGFPLAHGMAGWDVRLDGAGDLRVVRAAGARPPVILVHDAAMACGFLTSYPMNWWLIKAGVKTAM